MNDIMKTVQALEKLKGITKTIENETKGQKGIGIFGMDFQDF